ncbi:acyl-CoA dehydrogenase family protein [uncultured Paracoccus sp.]|uniref:acyl-CoA dehydrogenase family protein n=1 Tax=uncultured Paracoccus sp. TaxID=189685 RepID=UPI0025DAAED8|nr:acyl-CoA dehydrogenase family protein [uncultured Paracoccus sp.]
MFNPEAALQRDDIQELERLAIEEFRPRGRGYDAECSMPVENMQALFERGWLATTLPREMGGKGSNLDSDDPATYLQAIRVLARGCPGTAHNFQVHNHAAWVLNSVATPEQRELFLKPVFERPFLGTLVGSEARRKHMYQLNTSARRTEGGWIVHGEKNYATNAMEQLGFGIIFVTIEGATDYFDSHLMVVVDHDMEGVSIDTEWYRPAGMRACPSPVITLDNVFVPDSHVLGKPGSYPRDRWQGRFHLGFTANYLGTSEGMYDWFLDYMRQKGRGKDPVLQLRVGEMKVALDAARALFHRAIIAWTEGDVVKAELTSMAAKSTAAHTAFDLSHKIIHCAGSTALFDEFPLSRYIRDLETHVLHAGHDRTAQILGQSELGETFDSTLQR